MPQFGGKNAKKTMKTSSESKRHFTVVIGSKEHGLYVSSTPSSAAKKAVTKLCAANKSKKVVFHIREITQVSKKKTYGPYEGYIEKLKEPIELKGRVIRYKPVAKLSGKSGAKKGGMKGGGYDATLIVSKDINEVLDSPIYDRDNTLVFTIINNKTNERINYVNIGYLGKGTYGIVFLVENDKKEKYVIKITKTDPNFFLKEPIFLNRFMNKINGQCQYKAISQGITYIDRVYIGHIIFPFKGGINLFEVITRKYFKLIPKILKDVISCLIDINKYACHGDLKLENIVYDEETNHSFIIDYGLSFLFPLDINSLFKKPIGNRQISIEILIAYYLKFKNNSNIIDSYSILYSEYIDSIQKTIDNFGLFWLIIESICGNNILSIKLQDNEHLINKKNLDLFNNYLNFYFNLDNGEPTQLNEIFRELFNYSNDSNLRKEFVSFVLSKIESNKFSFYFNNNIDLFNIFMEKVLALVKVDPTTRISKEELLQDPFFHKITTQILPNISSELLKPNLKLPNIKLPNIPNYL